MQGVSLSNQILACVPSTHDDSTARFRLPASLIPPRLRPDNSLSHHVACWRNASRNTCLGISPSDRALRPRSARCAYRILDVVHHPCDSTRPLAVKVGGSGSSLISSPVCRPRGGLQLVYCGRVPGVCDGRGDRRTYRVKAAQKPGRAGSLAHQHRQILR